MEEQKPVHQFEDIITEVSHNDREFVTTIHQTFLQDGYKVKTESKEEGFVVTYSHPQTKQNLARFLFRKQDLFVCIFADNLCKYTDFLNSLPGRIEEQIGRSKACKQMLRPNDRIWKCIGGYDFFIRDNHYQKCRYKCFLFEIDQESKPIVAEFIENERKERTGQ